MAANRSRSPNCPSLTLGEAIDAMRPVYAKERRARFPRQSLAKHLGYSSINGRSLSKIGALRAYGLIDGREDALAVSPVAIAILEAPEGSADRAMAYRTAFRSPTIFQRIEDEHGGDTPSTETLRWWLTQQGYVGDAADRAMRSYLDSLELVNSIDGGYVQPVATEPPSGERPAFGSFEDMMKGAFPPPPGSGKAAQHQSPRAAQEGLAVGVHERVLQSGLLSKEASFRLIVSGHIGKAEFEKLLAKLNLDKDILVDEGGDEANGDPCAGRQDDPS